MYLVNHVTETLMHACAVRVVPAQQITEYKGVYYSTHPTIVMFWDVFHEMSLKQKKKFLCKCLTFYMKILKSFESLSSFRKNLKTFFQNAISILNLGGHTSLMTTLTCYDS